MSGPIHLPGGDGDEIDRSSQHDGPSFGQRVRERARAAIQHTPAELLMRFLAIPPAVAMMALVSSSWQGRLCALHSLPELEVSFVSTWPALFLSVMHLVLQPLLGSLLEQLERSTDGDTVQTARRFRSRLSFASFWADAFAVIFAFIGSVTALCHGSDATEDTVVGGIMGFVVCFLVLVINTGFVRHVSRIKVSITDDEGVEAEPRNPVPYADE